MRAILCREYYKKQTLGTFTLSKDDEELFKCRTLELAYKDNERNVSCIPEGIYVVDNHISPKFGRCFWVKEVPDREFILIHVGNFAGSNNPKTGRSDIRGCILTGEKFIDLDGDGLADITNSRHTFKQLLKVAPDGFILEVTQ